MLGTEKKSRRRAALGAATAAIACLVLAVPAFAFSAKATTTKRVKGLQAESVSAKCSGQTRVQFGGYQFDFGFPVTTDPHSVIATGMRITGSGRRLTIDGQGFSQPPNSAD